MYRQLGQQVPTAIVTPISGRKREISLPLVLIVKLGWSLIVDGLTLGVNALVFAPGIGRFATLFFLGRASFSVQAFAFGRFRDSGILAGDGRFDGPLHELHESGDGFVFVCFLGTVFL